MSGNSDKRRLQGHHLLADLFGIEGSKLKDPSSFLSVIKDWARAINLSPSSEPYLLNYDSDSFAGTLLFKEAHSHVSFHSYPSANYLALDIFISGDIDPDQLFSSIVIALAPQMVRKTTISRGLQE